jgi:hypothetical protein
MNIQWGKSILLLFKCSFRLLHSNGWCSFNDWCCFDIAISGGAVSGTIAQMPAEELSFRGFEANIPIEIHRAGL